MDESYQEASLKKIDRRNFMVMSTAGLTGTLHAKTRSGAKKEDSPKRRLLFNWDGSMIHCWGRTALGSQGPLTREQFTSLVFTPIEGTPVDTVLFSFGSGNVAEYQSNVLEWPGEADSFRFPESRRWHGGVEVDPKDQYLNPRSLADNGHNPPALIVEECHKRGLDVFVSLRMNDTHDGQHPRNTWPNPELPTFKRQNPDWLVGDLDWWSALDYSKPRVRALKLRVIEEFFDRWDFDGIELDWLRHTLYFPRGTERENGRYLTDLLRSVRRSLNDRARRRGRPIEIAVRIPETLDWCLEGGFEVPTWVSEDLVDLIILGQGLTELPTLAEFRKLMSGRQLPIYPCLYPYGNGYRMSPDEVVRGSAANLWRDGADGLYTFNWFFYGPWRKHLLNEIADPQLLAQKNKHYTVLHHYEVTPREVGGDYIRYNTVIKGAVIPFNLAVVDGEKTVPIPVAKDLTSRAKPPQQAELFVSLDYSEPGDILEISLNNKRLKPMGIDVVKNLESVESQIIIPPNNGMLGFPAESKVEMTFEALRLDVPVHLLHKGNNQLSLRLKTRRPGTEKPLRITRVELATLFRNTGPGTAR